MERVKVRLDRPNPLFETWLEEWMEEAASRNSELRKHFLKALHSLRKYPLPLKSGKDCIILQHFGIKLCSMLDKKLEKHKVSSASDVYVCGSCSHDERSDLSGKRRNDQHTAINTVHDEREAGLLLLDGIDIPSWSLEKYASLLSLYNHTQNTDNPGYILEADLLHQAHQLYGISSKPSLLSLLHDGIISVTGLPVRCNLTQHGIAVAKKICEIATVDVTVVKSLGALNMIRTRLRELHEKNLNKSEDLNNRGSKALPIAKGSIPSNRVLQNTYKQLEVNLEKDREQVTQRKAQTAKNNATSKKGGGKKQTVDNVQKDVYIDSNSFDIILLVDTQEISGGKTKPQHDATIVELTELGVLFEVRHLKVGDFAWIARCKITNDELILPYIVERKRIDDLSASITDGRFHEQKFRLKQSGIENLMYIVENYDKSYRLAIPHLSLMQASVNSLVQDGFTLKYTRNHKDSMFYLSTLTRVFNQIYKEKNLIGCKKEHLDRANILSDSVSLMEFNEFNKAASKQKVFKVNQMFVRQLLQLKGMSVDKALAIVESYPTPRILVDAFSKSGSAGETLLSGIQSGPKKRLLGPAISKTVYQLYTRKDLG